MSGTTLTLDSIASFLAGIGLFFIGIKGISGNMGELAGRRLRHWVTLSTGHPALAASVGLISGALTQSTNAVTVILISLAKADLITIGESAPILAWSNVGTAVLVMIAAIDIHLFVLALIGAVGICFYLNLDRSARWRPLVSTSFGAAMLFLGLELMRDASHQLDAMYWARDFLAIAVRAAPTALLAGIAGAVVTQSSAAISVMVVAMGMAGLLTLEQSALLVFGASIGSGIATYFMGLRIAGKARQLAILQALFKTLGVLLLLPLFFIERTFGVPLIVGAARAIAVGISHQVALIYLACQVAAVVIQVLFGRALLPLLGRLSPASAEESLSAPHYLYADALSEPASALALVDREQVRVASLMPLHLGIAEHLEGAARTLRRESVLAVATTLAKAIGRFLDDLTDTGASRDVLESAANRAGFNGLLLEIHESLGELALLLTRPFEDAAMRSLAENITQGLGALLLTAEETCRTRNADEIALLRTLTSEREGLVDSLRRRVIATSNALSAHDQESLFAITSLLERVVWLLRRYGRYLAAQTEQTEAEADAGQEPEKLPDRAAVDSTPATPT